jgi:hypothetical protein
MRRHPTASAPGGSANGVPLTMTVAEYSQVSGLTEYAIRQEIAAGRIPHLRVSKRGLVRILRIPALALLGADEREPK